MKKKNNILLCTDLDRTLLPNGNAPESRLARPAFWSIAKRDQVLLVYVTGRDITLTEQAITDYALPVPDFMICDVGTSVYCRNGEDWALSESWQRNISIDWRGLEARDLAHKIPALPHLQLQDRSRIKVHKLSYQATPSAMAKDDMIILKDYLDNLDIKYRSIYSIDETVDKGLVDILPASAGKLAAIDFLVQNSGVQKENVCFFGDSGNDHDVLLSGYKATVVANASTEFKQTVQIGRASCRERV